MSKKKIVITFFAVITLLAALPLSAYANNLSVKYTGLKKMMLKGSGTQAENKNYLKSENLRLVLEYINRHYFHGKYPEVRLNDGELLFPYGITTPTVFLRVRRITLIKLPAGTKIINVAVGNSANFKFLKISNETGDYLTLKPTLPALRTTMIIDTPKRLYYFNLVSTKHRYMPIVGFYFPGIYVKKYSSIMSFSQHNIATPQGISSINKLDFQYYVTGKGYKVERVFNDGKKTFIKLAKLNGVPLPAIFERRYKKDYLVNFLYRGGYYILRGIPKTIVLISRTQNNKKETEIHRGKKPSPWFW